MKATKLFVMLSLIGIATTAFAEELYKTNVVASYYADKFNGRRTANGEIFNMYGFTAAHKTLPFGTILKVTNLDNGKSVNVRVNDRGPFVQGREIDVSKAAAQQLGFTDTGTARVSLEIVSNADDAGVATKEAVVTQADKAEVKAETVAAVSTSQKVSLVTESEFVPDDTTVETLAGRWDIQLGAFSDKNNAQLMARRLVQAGFTNIAYQKVGNITRVVIRDVATEDVEELASKLDKSGFSQYIVRERKNVITQSDN